jgi:thiosulfate/3-mercaptopyruvate sulfurtransferase
MPRPAQLVSVFEAAGVSDGTHVVLYGAGSAHIPARAFVALEYLSHARVSVMDGGLETWRNEGRTLVHDAVTPPRGHLTAKINEDVLADAAWIRDRLEDPGVAIIDARPAAQYEGSSGRNLRPGHIPGAGNLFFADLLESDETPRLKPRNEVEAMFATAGYTPGATVVSYCQIGMRASYNYLIARHLGYDVKLYDGSWQEWGADDSLPAETGRMR